MPTMLRCSALTDVGRALIQEVTVFCSVSCPIHCRSYLASRRNSEFKVSILITLFCSWTPISRSTKDHSVRTCVQIIVQSFKARFVILELKSSWKRPMNQFRVMHLQWSTTRVISLFCGDWWSILRSCSGSRSRLWTFFSAGLFRSRNDVINT